MKFRYRHTRALVYILMFVVTTFLIFKMFPQRTHFDKKYEVGKPWHYELLTAPFDFPVYKTKIELSAERDSIKRFFVPYYIADLSKKKSALSALMADSLIDRETRYYLQKAIQNIYKKGVISQAEYDDFQKLQLKYINVSDSSNIWRKVEVKSLRTPSSVMN